MFGLFSPERGKECLSFSISSSGDERTRKAIRLLNLKDNFGKYIYL